MANLTAPFRDRDPTEIQTKSYFAAVFAVASKLVKQRCAERGGDARPFVIDADQDGTWLLANAYDDGGRKRSVT